MPLINSPFSNIAKDIFVVDDAKADEISLAKRGKRSSKTKGGGGKKERGKNKEVFSKTENGTEPRSCVPKTNWHWDRKIHCCQFSVSIAIYFINPYTTYTLMRRYWI